MIIKYNEWLLIEELMLAKLGMKPTIRGRIYHLCDDQGKMIRKLSKEEAIELIKENKLEQVQRNEHGVIWQ